MRRTLVWLVAVALLIASAAPAFGTPTGGESQARVALHSRGSRVSSAGVARANARGPRLRVSPRTIVLGGPITLVGHGFRRHAFVWLGVGPPQSEATRVGSARTNGSGMFRKTLDPRRPTGRWVALACQRGCRIKAGAAFRILSGRGQRGLREPPESRGARHRCRWI